jgi:hypothetical protein
MAENKIMKLEEEVERKKKELKEAEKTFKDFKKETNVTTDRLSSVIEAKDKEIIELKAAMEKLKAQKTPPNTLNPKVRAALNKAVAAGAAAFDILEATNEQRNRKKEDRQWPPEIYPQAQRMMDLIVQNDYTIFPADKKLHTGMDDFLFGKQPDGYFPIPPQKVTDDQMKPLLPYEKVPVTVKGKVSATFVVFYVVSLKCDGGSRHALVVDEQTFVSLSLF